MTGLDVRLAAVGTAVQAILGALILLDVLHLTDQQLAAVMVAVNAVIAVIVVWLSPYIPVVGRTQ